MTSPTDKPKRKALDSPVSRVRLDEARVAIALAGLKLATWHRGETSESGKAADAITAGHDAHAQIDKAIAALHRARAALSGELRANSAVLNAAVDARLDGTAAPSGSGWTPPTADQTGIRMGYGMLAPDAEKVYGEMLQAVADAQDGESAR